MDIYVNDDQPNSQKEITKVGQKFAKGSPIMAKVLKYSQKGQNFAKSGHTG